MVNYSFKASMQTLGQHWNVFTNILLHYPSSVGMALNLIDDLCLLDFQLLNEGFVEVYITGYKAQLTAPSRGLVLHNSLVPLQDQLRRCE